MTEEEFLDQLITQLAEVSGDPVAFVYWAFPWGQEGTVLAHRKGPESWQLELLGSIRDGITSVDAAIRQATVSGNGVGKSALVSWLILYLHCTFEDTKGVVTANTETQLKTKTWAELGKWFNLFIAKDLFRLTATALFSRDPDRDRTWRTDMVPWSEHNIVAFQGLHNEGRRLFIIMDEASGVPDGIWEASDGCMTDANTQRIFAVFGNPNAPKGRFRDCFEGGKFASMWKSRCVDSRTVSFTDKEEINQWVKAHGEDSDFVRVRVKGIFPRLAAGSFISYETCHEAVTREIPDWNKNNARVLGVDPARFGDDASVIVCRQGCDARSIPPETYYGLDTMQLATKVANAFTRHHAQIVLVDAGGVGGGVVDRLRQLRIPVYEVDFSSKPDYSIMEDTGVKYFNKRAEIWGGMKAWLETGCIAENVAPGYGSANGSLITTIDELTAPTYTLSSGEQIQLEGKKEMRKRGVPSPNWADALACTFALPIAPADPYREIRNEAPNVAEDYNPYSRERMMAQ